MGFLLNPLGFLGPITISLPFGLIGLWANPMNLLIPFFRLPWPIFYFLSISYNSHGLTTSFLGLPRPIYFLLGHLLSFVGLLTIILVILAQWSLFYYSLSPSFSYCWASSAVGLFCQKWVSTFNPLSIWIALAIHMRIYIYIYIYICKNLFSLSFVFFFEQWAMPYFLSCHEHGCLFEFPSLAVILLH